jgi:hypothetical protein
VGWRWGWKGGYGGKKSIGARGGEDVKYGGREITGNGRWGKGRETDRIGKQAGKGKS